MRVIGLISGGKDSCYNMMQCVAHGHQIVALANLQPQHKDELDSYMYQTVGHHAIGLYAEAMALPLFRRTIQGSAMSLGLDYTCMPGDEVEDLYELLLHVKTEMQADAVSVGAILSDYQRIRVENVCSRLSLTVLAYLWQREQQQLLLEMIQCKVNAIVIKVAALGLTPDLHLGKSLQEIYPHMLKMSLQYGLNVCGEGGEYETFTLDCPLFIKRIHLDVAETVLHSDDAFAPVAYLNLKELHLQDKCTDGVLQSDLSQSERLAGLPMKCCQHLIQELFADGEDRGDRLCVADTVKPHPAHHSGSCRTSQLADGPMVSVCNGFVYICGLSAVCQSDMSIQQQTTTTMLQLQAELHRHAMQITDLVYVHLYVSNMADFTDINSAYKAFFSINPPVRLCVQAALPPTVLLQLDCAATQQSRHTLHVQSLSHWAPANIAPYSQAVTVDDTVFLAGQIALCPATMTLIDAGLKSESRLSLRHIQRVLATVTHITLCDVTIAVCYVTSRSAAQLAAAEWNRAACTVVLADSVSQRIPPLLCVIQPALPRQANIEWHVTAHRTGNQLQESVLRRYCSAFEVTARWCVLPEPVSTTTTPVFCIEVHHAGMLSVCLCQSVIDVMTEVLASIQHICVTASRGTCHVYACSTAQTASPSTI